ncbi:MAG: hypothetical protein JEY96_09165 [Bacteroidales bacterium]|nr:hypothetical protein [Bacteroidales bacterium]
MKITGLIITLIIIFSGSLKAQNCSEFHKTGDCQTQYKDRYKLSSLSKSYYLEVGKTVTYEVILYGEYEIIIQCCTEEDYNPVRFKIRSSENGNIIYDNKYNNYINNLNLLLDHTELMSIEISVETKKKKLKGDKVCIGMAIYFEKE